MAASTQVEKFDQSLLAVSGALISICMSSSNYLHLAASSITKAKVYLANSVKIFLYYATVMSSWTKLINSFLFVSQKERW